MAKIIFMITALMTLHVFAEALPTVDDGAVIRKSQENIQIDQTSPTLDNEQYRLSEAPEEIDHTSSQGQRHKRFYNYFSFDFSPFGSFSPNFDKSDHSQETGANDAEEPLSQIVKRVQEILTYTKQQTLDPPSIPRYPTPFYVPVLYVPQTGCGCTSDNNETPSYDSESTIPTTNKTPSPPPANHSVPVTPSANDNSTKTTPDFFTRLSENMDSDYDDGNDGARPISLLPITPNTPLSKPPPSVNHGSDQSESNVEDIEASRATTSPPRVSGLPAEPNLPTNSVPTLCDGAVLTCCHRPEVTIGCFVKQGCPDLSPYKEPCSANVILKVIDKFQYYYANRQG